VAENGPFNEQRIQIKKIETGDAKPFDRALCYHFLAWSYHKTVMQKNNTNKARLKKQVQEMAPANSH
jgi:hypothetical protein